MKAPKMFNVFTEKLDPALMPNLDASLMLAEIEAMKLNAQGVTINSVSGTAIAGTRTSATVFTRSAGYWVDEVVIPVTSVVGTFVVGEAIVETTSGATGVVKEVFSDKLVIKTVTVAAFTGGETLTGSTSGATATGGTITATVVTDLIGQYIWSHASGVTSDGVWLRVASNTSTAITIDDGFNGGALHATGTAIILAESASAARKLMDVDSLADYQAMEYLAVSAAAVTIANTIGKHYLVVATTASNAVALTLPDARLIAPRTQIFVYVFDATTNAFTLVGAATNQTLDGVDIKTTPLATLNADGDNIVIERDAVSPVWTTTIDNIA